MMAGLTSIANPNDTPAMEILLAEKSSGVLNKNNTDKPDKKMNSVSLRRSPQNMMNVG